MLIEYLQANKAGSRKFQYTYTAYYRITPQFPFIKLEIRLSRHTFSERNKHDLWIVTGNNKYFVLLELIRFLDFKSITKYFKALVFQNCILQKARFVFQENHIKLQRIERRPCIVCLILLQIKTIYMIAYINYFLSKAALWMH